MIIPFLKGLATTLRMVFTKPITQQYPEEKREMFPRWRGHPQLTIDPDGRRRCVACTLCMVVCPSNAIRGIVAAEGTEHEKYPVQFTIDLQRCIFCGLCQEACPKGAIKLNNAYELAQEDKSALILNIETATQPESKLRLKDWL
ncbi:MAG: NuoI/complex I 23 kDa subunit family protein [Desulfobaccales bacterium]|jgi:NADH-quinone oxidoreductase chain I